MRGRKWCQAKEEKNDREDRQDSHHESPPRGSNSNQISGQMIPSSRRLTFDIEAPQHVSGLAAVLQHV
jgi:hypothetical protein